MGNRGKNISGKEREEIAGYLLDGKSVAWIARKTGRGRSAIYNVRRHLPGLELRSPRVALHGNWPRTGNYAVAEVACVSGTPVTGIPWVQVLPDGPKLPLHWAGEEITPEEASPTPRRVFPGSAVRLDVAFTLLSSAPRADQLGQPTITSGQVVMVAQSEKWNPSGLIPGCWLAQPLALYLAQDLHYQEQLAQMYGLRAYLKPGVYPIRVMVDCPEGKGDSQDYELVAPESWNGLQLRPRQVSKDSSAGATSPFSPTFSAHEGGRSG